MNTFLELNQTDHHSSNLNRNPTNQQTTLAFNCNQFVIPNMNPVRRKIIHKAQSVDGEILRWVASRWRQRCRVQLARTETAIFAGISERSGPRGLCAPANRRVTWSSCTFNGHTRRRNASRNKPLVQPYDIFRPRAGVLAQNGGAERQQWGMSYIWQHSLTSIDDRWF